LEIKCPHCGNVSEAKDYTLIYESVLYAVDYEVEREERIRPPILICPKCGKDFWLESPYEELWKKMKRE